MHGNRGAEWKDNIGYAMKFFFVIMFLICSINLVYNQNYIPNTDFEEWVELDTLPQLRPNYWRMDSIPYYLQMGHSIPIQRSSDKVSGNYSLGLRGDADTLRCTFLFEGLPGSVTGFFKLTRGNFGLRIYFYSKNSNNNYELMSDDIYKFTENSSWKDFSLQIKYHTTNLPKKCQICIYPVSQNNSDTTVFLLLDRLSFSKSNEINRFSSNRLKISRLYTGEICIQSISMIQTITWFDIQGRTIEKETNQGFEYLKNDNYFSKGWYLVCVETEEGITHFCWLNQ